MRIADLPISHGVVKTIWCSADGATLVTGNVDGEVLIWDTATWSRTVLVPQRQDLTLFSASTDKTRLANVLAVSPDGSLIVQSGADERGTLVIRDRSGREMATRDFGAPVFELLFSPDARSLAIAGLKTTIELVDVATWSLRAELAGTYEFVSNLLFSSDSGTLWASYERPSNVIKAWDMLTSAETASFPHTAGRTDYHALVYAPNGRELVLATTDMREICFVDLATYRVTREWNRDPNGPYEIAFTLDGSLMASASDRMILWDADTGDVLRTIASMPTEAGTVAFSPDGTLLFLTVWETGIQVWAVEP